jgi:hypothetical protein
MGRVPRKADSSCLYADIRRRADQKPGFADQQFNPNIFIPNLPIGDMPVWDITDLTNTAGSVDSDGFYPDRTFSGANSYVEAIADKMLDASGTGSSSNAYMSVDNLVDLELYVRTRLKMTPISIGGGRGYLFIVPSDVAAYLTNPNRSGSMGSVWKDFTSLSKEEQSIPGILGKFRSLWFIEDERAPTIPYRDRPEATRCSRVLSIRATTMIATSIRGTQPRERLTTCLRSEPFWVPADWRSG